MGQQALKTQVASGACAGVYTHLSHHARDNVLRNVELESCEASEV
jgi:hypothetical protein